MKTFIFVHGSWHGGWCWEKLVPIIEAAGHRALSPDLPGMGADATPLGNDPLEQWTTAITNLVIAQEDPVILVGHSRGGIVLSTVAERVPTHIERLVYVAAILLQDGESALSVVCLSNDQIELPMIVSHDEKTCTFESSEATRYFYHQSKPDIALRAVERLCPEPMIALTTPISISENRFGQVPRVYITTLQDRSLPVSMQLILEGRQKCERVFKLDSDHSPFYSMPDSLSEILISIAEYK